MLIAAEGISKNFGIKQLLNNACLYLDDGDKIGIIGLNGTGKSTLLRIIAGTVLADEGRVVRGTNVQISYLSQNPLMQDELTVLGQVFADFPPDFRALHDYEAKTMLTKLGITDFEQKIGALSGGQRKRVALATALIHPAEVLILDEPTNHLDSDMVAWLEEHLVRFTGGLIMVTHDRYFLERVVNKIVELSDAKLFSYEANYSKYLEMKAMREDMAEASERKRQSTLRREYQWIMRGARARGTKSKERIERYEALKEQEGPSERERLQMVTLASRMGKKIIELDNISKSFGDKTVLSSFSYNLLRDDRIGIVGKNGMGKSTLLNLIAGVLEPDSGSVNVGETIRIGYFSQECRELNAEQRVFDCVSEIAREVKTAEGSFSASQMLDRFLFPASAQYAPIGRLSGGERRRLNLLVTLIAAPNVLLLDEPTNDLDTETLSILEEYIESFPGAVIAVSHDRYFLDRVAQSIFELCEGGEIRRYPGNYSDYLQKREESIADDAVPKKEKVVRERGGDLPQKLKFTFKEEKEFAVIDDEIADLERLIKGCEQEQALGGTDYVKLTELGERHKELSAQLEAKTERWLYLNELAEKIASQ